MQQLFRNADAREMSPGNSRRAFDNQQPRSILGRWHPFVKSGFSSAQLRREKGR